MYEKNRLGFMKLMFFLLIFFSMGFVLEPASARADFSGTFTSGVISSEGLDYGTISWNETVPAGASIAVQAQAGTSADPDGSWTEWSNVNNGASLSGFDGKPFVRYKIVFSSSSDLPVFPSVSDVTIQLLGGYVISSPYDSEDSALRMSSLAWQETLPGNSEALLQIRTSPNGTTWSDWCGPDNGGAGCDSAAYFTNSNGSEKIDDMFTDGVGDRFVQYKISFSPDGENIPVVSQVSVNYALSQDDIRTFSGIFTSDVIGSGVPSDYQTISWDSSIPVGTAISMQVRAGDTAAPDGTWMGWSGVSSGDSLDAFDGKKYIQYKATLSASDDSSVPSLSSVTITRTLLAGELISSPFDIGEESSVLSSLAWSETLPDETTDIKFQLSTSADGIDWTDWCGPDNGADGCDTATYFTDHTGGETIDADFRDGIGDRYFRYKAVLSFQNGNRPILTSVTVGLGSFSPMTPLVSSVRIIGANSLGEVLAGRYSLSNLHGNAEGESLFRWLRSDSPDGEYRAIPGATNKTYTLTNDDLGKFIKFEVTPVFVVAPKAGAPVLSAPTGQINSNDYLNHILSTGQSLSVGSGGSPALSTTQPYDNKMLSGDALAPLVESGVETISSAMANFITSNTEENNYQIAVTRHGVGGTAYSGLKKGTAPYALGISQTSSVYGAAVGLGKTDRAIGVTVIHGESDHDKGITAAQYEGYLEEWQNDYQTDVRAITGQSNVIPLFTDQMGSFTKYGEAVSPIPSAQLAAAEDNPDKIYLVGPKYFLPYSSDGIHLTNTSYRWLGEYYGKVIKKVAVDKEEWKPLAPQQIYRIGKEIYAKFDVPEGPLQFDTSLVLAKENYGFEYYDASSSASISSVEIVGDDTVKVTLNTVPTGNDQRLRYAYTGTVGANAGANSEGSARGNLRDSDDTVSQYGNKLYNWAVHFDKAIVQDGQNSSPFSLSGAEYVIADRESIFSWNNSYDSMSGLAKYQLYVDDKLEADDINPASASISVNSELSCGNHSWYVKAFDNAGNSIRSYDASDLNINCGGSLIPPSKPSLANVNITTDNGHLTFDNLPTTITQIAISTSRDFTNSSWEDIAKKDELLKQYTNTDILYIKFRTQEGGVSDTIIKKGNNITKNEQGSVQNDINDGNIDTNNSNQSLQDGDLVKTPNNPDIYVIKYKNNKQYKRLLLSPTIFNSYLHLKWNNIKTISQQQSDQYQTSNLVKEATDTVIYTLTPNGDTGKRKPLNPSTPYDPDSIYEINKPERDSYELED